MYDFDSLAKAIKGIRENKKALMKAYKEETEKEKEYVCHLREAAGILELHGEVTKVLETFQELRIDRYDGNQG